ncbi:MAG: serine protease Do [Sulfurimonas sp.]|jgi:serine protease Do
MKKILLICLVILTMAHAKDSVNFKYADENTQRMNPTNKNIILSYNNILESVRTSLVNISTKRTISSSKSYGNLFLNNQEYIPQAGSGVIISKDGYIVTNNHLVYSAKQIKVSISGDKKEYEAKLIGRDEKNDMAIIKIDANNLNAITFYNSDKVKVGDIVFALGNTFGVGETIRQGIVSATKRSEAGIVEYENFIQTDVAINPGNSGGALINSAGHLIGINSVILSASARNVGISLAIPSNIITLIATQLINKRKYTSTYLGVQIADISEDMSSFYDNKFGALIISIEKNTPASIAGLKRGDLIISVNGKEVQNVNELKNTIDSYSTSRVVNIKFIRDKKIDIVNVKLSLSDKQIVPVTAIYKGMDIAVLSKELKNQLMLKANISGGVLIQSVEKNSEAVSSGIQKNDVVVQIENNEISTVTDFKSATNTQQKKRIYIFRRGKLFAVVL